MLRGNMTRWTCALAGVAVVFGSACPPSSSVDCSTTTVNFETPGAGAVVESPMEVVLNVTAPDGAAYNFEAATVSVGGNSFSGTVNGNKATFTGVTAPAGAQTLTATIAQGTCSKSGAQQITVREACSAAAVTGIIFPQDTTAPLGVANRAELPPGTNLQVRVEAMCVADTQVRIKRGATVVGELASFTNGSVTFTLPTLPDSDNARYDLFAELVRNGEVINTISTPGATASIQVNRVLPACAVTTSGTFDSGDDADSATPGFQMRVTGTMAAGTSGNLSIDGHTPVGVSPVGGMVSADFTLTAARAYTVTLTCTDGVGNTNTATGSFTVTDVCTAVAVTGVTFPQDTAMPTGVLNRTEIPPGTNLRVKVDAACAPSEVQVRLKRGTTEVAPLTSFTGGSVTFTVAGLPDSDDATYDLFAELVRAGTPLNTVNTPGATASIRVNRVLPGCSITTSGTFGPSADADNSTAGFQMRVNGTMATGTTGTLTVDGQTPVAAAPNGMNDVSADFTLTDSRAYTATLICTDALGNSNTATGSFTLDFVAPVVTVVVPANVDGGATMVVTQSPLQLQATTDAPDGSTVIVKRNGAQVGSGVVSSGMVALPVPFGADGTYTLTVEITDPPGNQGSATVSVVVALDGCGAILSRPVACPTLLTPAQLTGGAYSFQVTSKAVCANQPVALYRAAVQTDGGIAAESAAGSTTVQVDGLANFSPLALTSGDFIFRGEVTNLGVDAGVSSASCRVTVDLDGPSITSPVIFGAATVALLSADQDTQAGTPGVQRLLSFSARVPVGGRVDACTTQAVDPVTSMPRATSAECGTGWYVLQTGLVSPVNGFTYPEGTYSLKVVVVGGGLAMAPASPVLPMQVDGVRPCVAGMTRSLPQDTNMDNRLSIAELNGMPPLLQFDLGCGDVSSATLATANPVVIRDIVGGAIGAIRPSLSMLSGSTYTVTLTGGYSTETNLDLFVQLTDAVGNQNPLAAMSDPNTFTFRIDPVAPVCNIVSPSATQTLLGLAQAPGGQFDVVIATSSDVGTNGVNATLTGQAARALTPTLNQAQTSYTLTGDSTYTVGATCTDQAGNSTTATARTPQIDLVAPTCTIAAPANMSTSSVNDVTTTVAVTGLSNGDVVLISSSLGGLTNNELTVSGGTATGLVQYPNGDHIITASAADPAGNACIVAPGGQLQIELGVHSSTCNLDFAVGGPVVVNSHGNWVNRVSAANATGASPAVITVGATTSDCGAGKNVYLYQGPPATPGSAPQVTGAMGEVSFVGTSVSEGEQWTLTIDNGAGIYTHRSFIVSFGMPTVASMGLQRSSAVSTVIPVAANAPLVFGAAAGNRRVESATVSDLVFGDLDGVASHAQFQLTLTGIDGARVGTENAELEVLEGSTALMPTVAVTSAAFNPTLPRMSLNHRADDSSTTLTIRVTSPAGNVFTSTHVASVDVIAPVMPSVTQLLTSSRAATVGLSWSPAYDDGTDAASGGLTGGTPSAGYDVRWTTSSVPSNNSMATEADYFGSTSNPDGITAWSASAINKSLALPPINTYYIAVRAVDEVGNYSTYVAPTAVPNLWTETTITAPVASSNFGQTTFISRSLNSDSDDDLVVSATGEAGGGAVYVYFGGSTFGSQTGCPAVTCQRLAPSDATAGTFGSDLATGGNVGAVAAENMPDLLVSQTQSSAPNNGGRVVLYFGSTTAALVEADAIEFRGDSTFRIGFASRFIQDLDGDGLDEVAISAPVATVDTVTGRGRVYIYKGRTRAQWVALRTGVDGTSGVPFIPVSTTSADYVINGPNPILATAGNAFGLNRHGWASMGDLNGDTVPDIGIPTSRPVINRYRVISGAAILASTGAAPLNADTAFFEVTVPTTTETTVTSGLGAAVVSGMNVLDSVANDLVATSPTAGRVHIYSNPLAASSNPAATLTIQGPVSFGTMISAGALNSDLAPDLVVSLGNFVSNEAWVLYARSGGFDTSVGTDAAFWASRFQGATITGSTTTALGRGSAVGDLDGQNGNDLILGDERANLVKIWR